MKLVFSRSFSPEGLRRGRLPFSYRHLQMPNPHSTPIYALASLRHLVSAIPLSVATIMLDG
ncbi:hypothetical protein ACYG9R_28845 [Mesorhizobium sp. RSR565B]|uniref:hypothetical protein n=1 Tax=unclassified Mesorhizobium TaxID=325217 RepID=UPI0012DD4575|nr:MULTISPECIES: hypothetical protein [unclassified Mesorhizobium]